jgi:glutathione S-transferase
VGNLLDVLAFRWWLVSLVVLFFKMYANSLVQGVTRSRADAFAWPEDARVFGRGAGPAERDPEMVERASRCWRNDLENIPMYLFLGLGFVLAGGPPWWAALYFTAFTVARVAHTFFYLRGMQPHRTIAYAIGLLVCVALSVHLVIRLLTVPVV